MVLRVVQHDVTSLASRPQRAASFRSKSRAGNISRMKAHRVTMKRRGTMAFAAFQLCIGSALADPSASQHSSGEVFQMDEKLDPKLLQVVEKAHADTSAGAVVQVLVGLDAALDETQRKDLASRGLTVRSEIGTVLTGSVAVQDVRRLAESPRVTKIELSGPMFPEGAE